MGENNTTAFISQLSDTLSETAASQFPRLQQCLLPLELSRLLSSWAYYLEYQMSLLQIPYFAISCWFPLKLFLASK